MMFALQLFKDSACRVQIGCVCQSSDLLHKENEGAQAALSLDYHSGE